MPKIEVPFANLEGSSSVTQNSRETLINMFSEIETSGHSKLIRRQRKSVQPVYAKTGVKRCVERNSGIHYTVIGSKFGSYDGTNYTEHGTLDSDAGRCTMVFDDNGSVLISDGTEAYHWNGTTFSKPDTNGDIGPLTFLGGFAVGSVPGTGQFKWSAVNDMTSWDALDFATAEGKTDNMVRVYAAQNELWLYGTETIEIWTLSGGTDTPFSYNAAMQRGLGAPLAVVAEDNSLMWLGDDFIFYRADGFRPMRISNHTVERAVADLSDSVKATCEAFSYSDDGHKFITFTFPGHLTLQYNVATMFWNVARTFGQDDWDILGPQYSNTGLYLTTAGLASLVRGINTDNGGLFARGGISPQLAASNNWVVLRSYFLDCKVGRAAIGLEPRIMLRIARDGEKFGNERWRSLGVIGEYVHRAVWRGCGRGRRMTIEIMFTDDADFSIMGAQADGEILDG